MIIKNFAIFKNEKATGMQPQYLMYGRPENSPEGTKNSIIGSLWLKQTSEGKNFYSGAMKEEFTKDDGTKYDGFMIISEAEYKRLTQPNVKTQANVPQQLTSEQQFQALGAQPNVPQHPLGDAYPTEQINPEDIPF